MFLATTSLKDFWDAQDEVLVLGPWCVRFEDPDWLKGIRHRMLPNVWDDRERLEKGARYCQEIQPELFERLAGYLNGVHGTALSPRYWRILLGAWLLYYTHQLFDRYCQITDALEAFPDADSQVLDPADFVVPRDNAEFLPLYHTDHFNLQLYSQIFRSLGKRFPTKRHTPPSFPAAKKPGRLRGLVDEAAAAGSEFILTRARVDVVADDLYPTGHRLLWRAVLGLGGKVLPLLRRLPESLRADAVMDPRRLGLAGLEAKDEFSKLLIATLPYALPAIALEGFAAARAATPALTGPVPGAVLSSVGLFYNDFFKFAAAEWAERGAKLWGLQHGGQYGMAKYSLAEELERGLCDRYFTWGWASTATDGKLRDLPVPKLSEAAARGPRRAAAGDDVLVLTLENVRNTHHLFPHPLGWQWEGHFGLLERFIAAAGDDVSLRLYVHDYGWNRRGRLNRRFPRLRFDSGALPLMERASQARLVVTDYPGTPFAELLACDIPSVHFWEEAHWEMRAEAKPYLDALKRAGIVHTSPESAARQAAEVRADPARWWGSGPVQAARREFVERYARVREDWLGDWKRALSEPI